jgi:D-arabinose 1-dehydrogenase-like Zn-dependent alcohol dehydrogenase
MYPQVELFSSDQTARAYDRPREGKIQGRAVIAPNG